MDRQWDKETVGGIVTDYPAAALMFRKKGIDFCCGGHRKLGEVLKEKGLDPSAIGALLDEAVQKSEEDARLGAAKFTAMKPAELAGYIETMHHTFMRDILLEISGLLRAVLQAHGRNHPELFEIHRLYHQLQAELEQHLVKEETVLFPALEATDPAFAAEGVKMAAVIREEHEKAGGVLKELRSLSGDYRVPEDACPTYRHLYEHMADMEGDLFQHIHLENNILLK